MDDLISRQAAIDALDQIVYEMERMERWNSKYKEQRKGVCTAKNVISDLPSAQPERTRMSNKEWIDFLVVQFDISRTSAKEMLHGMMKMKKEDNFKRDFNPLKQECESVEILEVQDG